MTPGPPRPIGRAARPCPTLWAWLHRLCKRLTNGLWIRRGNIRRSCQAPGCAQWLSRRRPLRVKQPQSVVWKVPGRSSLCALALNLLASKGKGRGPKGGSYACAADAAMARPRGGRTNTHRAGLVRPMKRAVRAFKWTRPVCHAGEALRVELRAVPARRTFATAGWQACTGDCPGTGCESR